MGRGGRTSRARQKHVDDGSAGELSRFLGDVAGEQVSPIGCSRCVLARDSVQNIGSTRRLASHCLMSLALNRISLPTL